MISPDAVHHQVAYVTSDITRAQAVFAEDYGVAHFFGFDGQAGGEGGPAMKIALANVGGLEIELIEPGAGAALYADVLPSDGRFAMVLHHLAIRVTGDLDAWTRHRAGLDETRHPVVLEGGLEDELRYVYTDERARLGHYLEHVWMSPDLFARMEGLVPHYPAAA